MTSCTHCDADWSRGQYRLDCPQCGGGALERSCPICRGRCGRTWKRAVLDSQDANEAHWIGACGLPRHEPQAAIKEQLEHDQP